MDSTELRTLVLIAVIATLSPLVSDVARRWTRLPGVVVEIGLGILIGPQVLGWADPDAVIDHLAEMGLVLLIFLAGFEIDPAEVKGRPTRLAVSGWLMSLVAGTLVAVVLHALDVTSGVRFVAIALATTAIGTLLPILGDAGALRPPFAPYVLAGGAIGEIGPIVAISLALATDNPGRTAVALVVFGVLTIATGFVATRSARPRIVQVINRTMLTSGQLGVRISVVLCVLLVWMAQSFGLDVLLGAFAAGMVARLFLVAGPNHRGRHEATTEPAEHAEPAEHGQQAGIRVEVQHRLEALGFGFFIPLFFVISGVRFDVDALTQPAALVKVPLFFALFVVVRGLPAILYRHVLPKRDVIALGLLQAAALPLVVVITGIGVSTGRMRSDNAAAMVGAGLLSVVVLPLVALAVRGRGGSADAAAAAGADADDASADVGAMSTLEA